MSVFDKRFYVECSCDSPEHVLRFSTYSEEKEVYVDFFLGSNYNLIQRMIHGIKYIFGYKSRYGHFSEIVMGYDSIKMLKNELESFLNSIEEK